jgi:hypothetical protein
VVDPASRQCTTRTGRSGGGQVIYGPGPRDVLIDTLQRELAEHNREIHRLHDVIGQQA